MIRLYLNLNIFFTPFTLCFFYSFCYIDKIYEIKCLKKNQNRQLKKNPLRTYNRMNRWQKQVSLSKSQYQMQRKQIVKRKICKNKCKQSRLIPKPIKKINKLKSFK